MPGKPPSFPQALRKARWHGAAKTRFELAPLAPFRLDLTVWALRRRPNNLVDLWDGRCYRRLLRIDSVPTLLRVEQNGPPDRPSLIVDVSTGQPQPRLEERAVQMLNRILSLQVDLSGFYRMAKADRKIGPLIERFAGAKPPRFPSVFEALLNAVACQQLSVLMGILLLNRLTKRWAASIEGEHGALFTFPSPLELSSVRPAQLRALGFSRQKERTILGLARGCATDEDRFEALATVADDEVLNRLLALKGIGRWSAEYVMLRGLGRLNVFPGDDVAGQKNLHKWLGLRKTPDYEKARKLLSRWHPYEGLLYFHFLLASLDARGLLQDRLGFAQQLRT
jgi:DNA-3-methyladenine glycosylase II